MQSNNISFVVVSCDKYNDLWDLFFNSYEKYWGDLNFNTYLITNFYKYNNTNVTTINIGKDLSFTENILNGIAHIEDEWVILWLEDCIPCGKIESSIFFSIIQEAIKTVNLGYLKLSNDLPLSYCKSIDENFGLIPKGVRYRSAIGMSLYRKDVLQKLLKRGENAWQADKSTVSDTLDEGFYALSSKFFHKPLMPYINSVIKGYWNIEAFYFLRKQGFGNLLKSRKIQKLSGYIYLILFRIWSLFLITLKLYWFKK